MKDSKTLILGILVAILICMSFYTKKPTVIQNSSEQRHLLPAPKGMNHFGKPSTERRPFMAPQTQGKFIIYYQ